MNHADYWFVFRKQTLRHVLLLILSGRIRSLVCHEDYVQPVEFWLNGDGCALLQAKGEHHVFIALLNPHSPQSRAAFVARAETKAACGIMTQTRSHSAKDL